MADGDARMPLKRRPKGAVFGCGFNKFYQLGVADNGTTDHENVPLATNLLEKKKVVNVFASGDFSLCLTASGEVYSWGKGKSGQLGYESNATNISYYGRFPTKLQGALKKKKVLMAACGSQMALAILDKNAGLVCWGDGKDGKLGIKEYADRMTTTPIVIPAFVKQKVLSIACGTSHCIAVTSQNNSDTLVFTWGNGEHGKLGNNSDENQLVPYMVEPLVGCRVVTVHCGSQFTAALTERGDVYTFGSNECGYLGHGHTDSVKQPLVVAALCELDVLAISAGSDHMAAVTTDGELYTWGYGSNGRLAHGDQLDCNVPKLVTFFDEKNIRIRQVSCGGHHTAVVTEDGDMYSFGWNYKGQLGIPEDLINEENECLPHLVSAIQGNNVIQVACGDQHTIILLENSSSSSNSNSK